MAKKFIWLREEEKRKKGGKKLNPGHVEFGRLECWKTFVKNIYQILWCSGGAL